MRELIRRRWLFFLMVCGVGLAMRLLFIHFPRAWDDDADVYAELGRNLLRHGIYGFADDDVISPSLIRLPGYPLLLGFAQILFHTYWVKAVLLLQVVADLGGCFLLAAFTRRHVGERAALIAFALGALCPFTAAYAATVLTESLSIFAVMLAVYAFGLFFSPKDGPARDGMSAQSTRGLLLLSAAAALAMLLRPDGALVLLSAGAGLLVYLRKDRLRTVMLFGLLSVLPLVPWAARNWHTFHVVQPLAPRHVNDPGEPVNLGFYRWMRTWSVDLSNTGQVFWQVGTNPISPADVPARAYDSAAQRERTLELLAEYNLTNSLNPELDAKFAALAAERIRNHPLHYYVVMPLWRVADMWLRPRTEALDMDVFWWNFNDHPAESILDIALGLLDFVYVAGALLAFMQRRVPFAVFFGGYLLLRCALLGTMENSEPRYTLEGFPIVIVCAAVTYAAWFAGRSGARSGPAPRAGS